jgi:DNA-directed RNA polymerase
LDEAKVKGEGNKQEAAFVYEKERKGHNKFMGVVGLNDQLYKLIMEDDVDVFSSMATHNRPMVIPPRDWTDPNDGGYCAVKVELMRTNGCRSQRVRVMSLLL